MQYCMNMQIDPGLSFPLVEPVETSRVGLDGLDQRVCVGGGVLPRPAGKGSIRHVRPDPRSEDLSFLRPTQRVPGRRPRLLVQHREWATGASRSGAASPGHEGVYLPVVCAILEGRQNRFPCQPGRTRLTEPHCRGGVLPRLQDGGPEEIPGESSLQGIRSKVAINGKWSEVR